MIVLWIAVSLALVVIAGTSMVNVLTFPRLRPARPAWMPRVSVLVPARDEAAVIAATVRRLLAQDYDDYEVIVLDDASTDGTADIARQVAGDDPRLRVLTGAPLPPGWLGKNWACHQLAEAASGDLLVFTDADTRWEPDALRALVAAFERHGAEMVTVWPSQETHTWAERLTVPLMALVCWVTCRSCWFASRPGRSSRRPTGSWWPSSVRPTPRPGDMQWSAPMSSRTWRWRGRPSAPGGGW